VLHVLTHLHRNFVNLEVHHLLPVAGCEGEDCHKFLEVQSTSPRFSSQSIYDLKALFLRQLLTQTSQNHLNSFNTYAPVGV